MTTIAAAEVIIDLLQRGHAVEFRARGDSMHPVIREDDLLHVEPTREVRVGDVVLTLAERGLTAHRVIAIRGDVITTRGDNTPAADPVVSRSRVLGRVLWVDRGGQRFSVRRAALMIFLRRCAKRLRRR
jgi:phage repressor protein C with HTH and peptisase S24 domain